MKRIFIVAFTALAFCTANAQTHEVSVKAVQQQPAEVLQFAASEYDFGKIPQNKPVYHSFEIVNKGTSAVKLDNVVTTCGCTTPEYSRDPIAPGASTTLKVGYNAATEGYFEKYITVTYNGNQTKQIKIKGTVWKAPVGSAPANQSVQFLKQQIQ